MTDRSTDCERLLRRVSAYLDGELDAPQCVAIEEHCAGCAECRRIIEGLRETIGLCRDASRTPLPEAVRAKARDSIRRLMGFE